MKNISLIQNRNEALVNLYMSLMSSKSINRNLLDRYIAIDYIIQQPAERFYITPKMAERYVLGYLRGDKRVLCSRKRAMIEDLVSVYRRIVNSRDGSKKVDIWEEVVSSPAKSYYITARRAKEIVFGYKCV